MTRLLSLATLTVSLFASAAGAQAVTRQIGVDAGILRAAFVGSDAAGTRGRTAPFAGAAFVLQPAGSGFGLLTGLYYAPRGAQQFPTPFGQKVKLSYLEIPVLARYRIPLLLRGTRIGSAVLGGLTIGIKRGCSIETKTATATVSTGCLTAPPAPRISVGRVDAALSGGVELLVPLPANVLLVPSIRYSRGLIDLAAGVRVTDTKNAALQFGVGLRRQI